MSDSRLFVPELSAGLERLKGGRVRLLSPGPGYWRDVPAAGTLLRPGASLGVLEVLGLLHRVRVPEGAVGVVVDDPSPAARLPVDYGAPLLTLDPEGLGAALSASLQDEAAPEEVGGRLVLAAPTSGRFYRRAGPGKPNFVELGQLLERGQTVGLLEVMKTFTRVNYDDPRLPERAKIVAIVAADQAELGAGDAILHLEPES